METDVKKFNHGVTKEIDYYVYALFANGSNKPFYIGKGKGNRVFAHINGNVKLTKKEIEEDLKYSFISKSNFVTHKIIRHGLDNETAYKVEASLIDIFGLSDLSNKVRGKDSFHGIMTIDEINILYASKPVPKINEKVILININRQYGNAKGDPQKLYNATKGDWVLGSKKDKADYAFTIANGIIYELIKIKKGSWKCMSEEKLPKKGGGTINRKRWAFEGTIEKDIKLRDKYINKSVTSYWKTGSQNPIRYSY